MQRCRCRVRRWRDAEALRSSRCRGAEFLSRCRGFIEVIVHSKVIVQMQNFYRGTKVKQRLCRGAVVQMCRGAEVQRCSGIVWCRGAEV